MRVKLALIKLAYNPVCPQSWSQGQLQWRIRCFFLLAVAVTIASTHCTYPQRDSQQWQIQKFWTGKAEDNGWGQVSLSQMTQVNWLSGTWPHPLYQPHRHLLSQMHIMKYTRFIREKATEKMPRPIGQHPQPPSRLWIRHWQPGWVNLSCLYEYRDDTPGHHY